MKRSLSDAVVKEMRELYASGLYTQLELSKKYNCSVMTISLWKDEDNTRRALKFKPRVRDTTYDGYPHCKHCGIVLHEKRLVCDCQTKKEGYTGSKQYFQDLYGAN